MTLAPDRLRCCYRESNADLEMAQWEGARQLMAGLKLHGGKVVIVWVLGGAAAWVYGAFGIFLMTGESTFTDVVGVALLIGAVLIVAHCFRTTWDWFSVPPPPSYDRPSNPTDPHGFGWYVAAIRKYAVFEGRAERKEYWMFFLFNFIFIFAAFFVDAIIAPESEVGFVYFLYGGATFVPGLAIAVRRLHDTGRNGGWVFIGLIPLLGLVLFILLAGESQSGPNQYGPHPKA